jgi:hypothetical protein
MIPGGMSAIRTFLGASVKAPVSRIDLPGALSREIQKMSFEVYTGLPTVTYHGLTKTGSDPRPQSFVATPILGFAQPVCCPVTGGAAIIWPPGNVAVVEADGVADGGALGVKPHPDAALRSSKDPLSAVRPFRNLDLISMASFGWRCPGRDLVLHRICDFASQALPLRHRLAWPKG